MPKVRGGHKPSKRELASRAANPRVKTTRVQVDYKCGHIGTAIVYEGQAVPEAGQCQTCYWKARAQSK